MLAYKEADERAESGLPATHPVRLDCGLSRARFMYAADRRAERAIEILRRTYDAAMPELDNLDEESNKDASLTLLFIRRTWTQMERQQRADDEAGWVWPEQPMFPFASTFASTYL